MVLFYVRTQVVPRNKRSPHRLYKTNLLIISIVVVCVYCCICLVCVVILSVFLYCVGIAFFTLDAVLLTRSQYSEGPATGQPDTGFSWFHCAYKQMLRWFPRFQVATTCFSYSPPDLNLVVANFMFCLHVK